MDLFRTLDDLKPFIFRIVDNGGQSADRYTVITCDGDYYAMSSTPFHPQGVGMTGEGIDVQGVADRVEAGVERDLRWIDLPVDCQRCVMGGLNQGFRDYIESAPAVATRDDARDWQGLWTDRDANGIDVGPIYKDGDGFRVRDDEHGDSDLYATFAEAVRHILPEDYALAGSECHTQINMWDTEGGPVTPWDRDAEPPVIDHENHPEFARAALVLETADPAAPTGFRVETVAWFANETDAVNYLDTDKVDADRVAAGHYTIDDLDHPDAEE